MINEKRLSEIRIARGCSHDDAQELLSLARLGLEFKNLIDKYGSKERLLGCIALGEYAGAIVRGDPPVIPAFELPDAEKEKP